MTQYIDKDAVVAEIEKRIKEIDEIGTYLSPKGVLTNLLCHLDTLEAKEVDFEKELDRIWFENKFGDMFDNSAVDFANVREIRKHFFELGLKTKGK